MRAGNLLVRALADCPGLQHAAGVDDYEWSWTGTLSRWALDHPEDPDSDQALKAADDHRHAWPHGYRGTLGFVTLYLWQTNDG